MFKVAYVVSASIKSQKYSKLLENELTQKMSSGTVAQTSWSLTFDKIDQRGGRKAHKEDSRGLCFFSRNIGIVQVFAWPCAGQNMPRHLNHALALGDYAGGRVWIEDDEGTRRPGWPTRKGSESCGAGG